MVGAAVALLVVAGLLVWFQPYKLFLEDTVEEAVPSSAQTDPVTALVEDERPPKTLARGTFRSLEHTTSGRALTLELADGTRYLRLEDLDTSNGPDLRVYLSKVPASDDWYAYGEGSIDLGALKGNRGSQNYQLPPGLDPSDYRSAVIWCRRFSVGFGVAPLERT